MTTRTIDLDQVRVIQADNYKGNSRVYLEIMDVRVLYTSPGELAASKHFRHHVTGNAESATESDPFPRSDFEVDTEGLADLFRRRLAHFFAGLLLEDDSIAGVWSTDTDREIDYTKPRLEEQE